MTSSLQSEVDSEFIAHAVARHRDGARVRSCRQLGGGRCNTVYGLDTDCGPLVIKVAPVNARMENQHQLLKEPHLSRLLGQAGIVPVPEVHGASGADGPEGRAYVLMDWMPGTPLHIAWDTLSAQVRHRLAGDVGQLTARLAGIRAPLFGWMDHRGLIQGYPTWAAFFRERGFLRLNYLGFVSGVKPDRLRRLKEVAAAAVSDPALQPSFVHANLANMSNIMIEGPADQPRIAGLIDFEHAQFADPDVELAGFMHWGEYYDDVERAYRSLCPATASWPRRAPVYALLEEIRQLISWYHLTPDKYRAALHNNAARARVEEILALDGDQS